jgi:hypothetical protein
MENSPNIYPSQAGATIWLRNVNAPLRRCLHLLSLNALFHFGDLG